MLTNPLYRFIIWLTTRIKHYLVPLDYVPEDGIAYWRDRILSLALLFGLTLGTIVFWQSIIFAIRLKYWSLLIVDTIVYLWLIVLVVKRSLPYHFRAYSAVMMVFIIGITLIFSLGPLNSGARWLFFLPIICALLIGDTVALLTILFLILTSIAIGTAIHFHVFGWGLGDEDAVLTWNVTALNVIFLNSIATLSINAILKGLQKSLEKERSARDSLDFQQRQLIESNKKLKNEIAERKEAEKSLSESEEKYRTLVSRMNEGVLIIDEKLRIVFGNSKIFQMIGYDKKDLIGHSYSKLFTGESLSKMKTMVESSSYTLSNAAEVSANRKDGEKVPLLASGSPVFMQNGAWQLIVVLTDITKLKEAEYQLIDHQTQLEQKIASRTKDLETAKLHAENANLAKSEFLANISHELRTPMHHILNYSKFGLNKFETAGKEKLLHYFQQIRTTGERLLVLLNDLLDLSKLESGKTDIKKQNTDLSLIVNEVLKTFDSSTSEKQLEIEVIKAPDVNTLLACDSKKITQVLENIISNAIKYSPEEDSIVVKFSNDLIFQDSQEQTALKVSVIDNGVGIPEDEKQLVFEKFIQSSKTKSGAGGTGLGLSISKQIIELHHGSIWAEANPTGGTIVSFKIPH